MACEQRYHRPTLRSMEIPNALGRPALYVIDVWFQQDGTSCDLLRQTFNLIKGVISQNDDVKKLPFDTVATFSV